MSVVSPSSSSDTQDGDESPSGSVPVTIWGPKEPKRVIPWGMGDVVLGFVYSQLFAAIPLIAIFIYAYAGLPADATAEKAESVITNVTKMGPVIVGTMVLSWAGWMLAVWWAGTRKGDRNLRELIKWKFVPRRDIPIGIGIALGYRLFEIGLGYVLRSTGLIDESITNTGVITSQTGIWLVLVALGAAIGAPIVEEIFFRGLFLSVAVRNWGAPIGVIVTSVAFGLMHIQPTVVASIYVVGQTTMLGVVLALLVLKTGRLGPALFLHLGINISGVALALAFAPSA